METTWEMNGIDEWMKEEVNKYTNGSGKWVYLLYELHKENIE
jgi:hypothetical protein